MVIVNILPLSEWYIRLVGTPYNQTPKLRKKVKQWCVDDKADICWNFGFFNMKNYVSCTYIHTPQGDLSYGGQNNGTLDLGNEYKCAGNALGIKDDVVVDKNVSSRRTRCGIGKCVTGEIIMAQCNVGMTEKAFCTEIKKYVNKHDKKVAMFLMEDGGASTSQYSDVSKRLFAPEGGRMVATVVTATRKPNVIKITKDLKRNDKGKEVEYLQQLLGGVEITGVYDYNTELAVVNAKRLLGLKSTSKVFDEEARKAFKVQ